ncbi:accelerated cell death 11-like [Syzygium oleosum]|uniref:accelerated cell death 11-like n=1 Tax=Syzygium oleosum TaxID=219896 RepID=UPI0011D19EC0|nr:accelerated cell death 11-like [Syzygium oleosum]
MAEPGDDDKPLRKIAQSFKELAAALNSETADLNSETADIELAPFSQACSLVLPLIGSLGIAFKFAEMDLAPKVRILADASKSIKTLPALLDCDVESNCISKPGCHSRHLLRVNRGLDVVRVFFEQILESEGDSYKDAAKKAYAQVLAPFHGWAIRKAVAAAINLLPTTGDLLKKVKEDENSAKTYLRDYIVASEAVILYVNGLFLSRGLGVDLKEKP